MTDVTIDDLLDYALSNDAVKAQEAMDELMTDRVDSAIEARKFAMVNSFFNGVDPDETPEENEDNDEGGEGEQEEENEEQEEIENGE